MGSVRGKEGEERKRRDYEPSDLKLPFFVEIGAKIQNNLFGSKLFDSTND